MAKVVRIVSSPGTEYEVLRETSPYAPPDTVYFITDNLEFGRTAEQSRLYIEELQAENKKLRDQIDKIWDILEPEPEYDDDTF